MTSPIKIFCCYAHEDQVLLKMLKTHLLSLQGQGSITTWADADISPWVDWEIEVNRHINSAHIILLLISPDFMASNYCYSKEMTQALQRHQQGSARVIPIIFRPVSFQGAPFARLHALPKNAIPLNAWSDINDGFLNIVEGIQLAIKTLSQTPLLPLNAIPQPTINQPPDQVAARTYRVPLLNTSSLLATNQSATPLISAVPQTSPFNPPSYPTNNQPPLQQPPIPQLRNVSMPIEPERAIKVFYCYAHEDRALRDKLDTHLSPLKRLGHIIGWYDRDIKAGTEWEQEIEKNLITAGIILLLISPDFMASDYCYSIEMSKALELHRSKKACVIPVILRPVDWEGTPIEKLHMLPTDGKPITTWPNRDKAFQEVAQGVRAVIETLLTPPQLSSEITHQMNIHQEALPELELIRTRCKQGYLIITNKRIAIEQSVSGKTLKSQSLLRNALTSVESKTVMMPLFGAGGGMDITFHGKGRETLIAELVSPYKRAQEILAILSQ